MSQPPLVLTATDLEAYAAEKAASNVFTRPRIEVKQRALVWSRSALARLAGAGLELEVQASDDHPSLRNKRRVEGQWIWFLRPASVRRSLEPLLERRGSILRALDELGAADAHAHLALSIAPAAIEVAAVVPPGATVDRENLRLRLETAPAAGAEPHAFELASAIRALPEQFTMGAGVEVGSPCVAVTGESVRAWTERAEADRHPLWIRWSVPRQTALDHADILGEELEDALTALAPVFGLLAWSAEEDCVDVGARRAALKTTRARTHGHLEAESARADDDAHDEGEGNRERGEEDELRPPAVTRSAAVLEKGTRVRVLRGPFEDKCGVVSELDGRGGARVLLGLLATRLPLVDLEPVVEGRDRPALQSSHRRHLASAPRRAR